MAYQNVKGGRIGRDLTQGPVLMTLLTFAGPIVLSSIIQQIYSMVDLAVIGQYVGSTGSVGVSTGGELADFLLPVAMGFSTAGQIYIAQLVGAHENEKAKEAIGTLLTTVIALSFILIGVVFIMRVTFLHLLNCPEEAMGQASSYMIITAFGFPFVFGYNAIVGVLRGMGEAKRPLIFVIVAATVNIFADILLVAVIPLEAAGTAIATVLSQIGCCVASVIYLYKNKEKFDFEIKRSYFKIHKDQLAILVKLAIPQIARAVLIRFSMLWTNAHVNSYGLVISATNSIGNKIQRFMEVFIQGLDTACAAMIAQNLGAKKYDRAIKIVWTAFGVCMAISCVCAFIALEFPERLFAIMTKVTAVQQMGKEYLKIIVVHFFVSSFTVPFQAMITGSGFVSLGFFMGILDAVICRISISLFLFCVVDLGYKAFWWGTSTARFLPGVIAFIYCMSGRWRTRKLLTERKT